MEPPVQSQDTLLKEFPEWSPFSFASLRHGRTHYNLQADTAQRVLVEKNCSVLCFDLYGHGLSDTPLIPLSEEVFAEQALELLELVAPSFSSYHIIGNSMGCIIASKLALMANSRVSSLNLVVPAGLPLSYLESAKRKSLKIPYFGEFVFQNFAHKILYGLILKSTNDPELRVTHMSVQNKFLKAKMNYRQALLSMVRYLNFDAGAILYPQIAAELTNAKVRIFLGADDKLFDSVKSKAIFQSYLPKAEIHVFEKYGHNLLSINPEGVVDILLQ